MKRRWLEAPLAVVTLLSLPACGGSQGETESAVGTARSAFEDDNALNVNALNVNALNVNALNVNALNVNALNVTALDPGAMVALQDPGSNGDLSRQLLKFTVSCALSGTQSFTFSWTDALGVTHVETYPGLLGLASDWATGPLSSSEGKWISACLASRVNWYGVSVTLSSRGAAAPLRQPSAAEMASFPFQEGAFWGNLFSSTPALYACHDASDDAHSRASMRVCATGWLDGAGNLQPCGMIQLAGPCNQVCAAEDTGTGFWRLCTGNAGDLSSVSVHVITTYLQ